MRQGTARVTGVEVIRMRPRPMLAGTGKVLMGVFVPFRAMLVGRHTDRDPMRLGTAQRSDRGGHCNEPQQQPGRQEAA